MNWIESNLDLFPFNTTECLNNTFAFSNEKRNKLEKTIDIIMQRSLILKSVFDLGLLWKVGLWSNSISSPWHRLLPPPT